MTRKEARSKVSPRRRQMVERDIARADAPRRASLPVWRHLTATDPGTLPEFGHPGDLFIGADGSWWRRTSDGWVLMSGTP